MNTIRPCVRCSRVLIEDTHEHCSWCTDALAARAEAAMLREALEKARGGVELAAAYLLDERVPLGVMTSITVRGSAVMGLHLALAQSPSDWLAAHDKAKNATIAMLREALETRDRQIDHLFRHSGRQGAEDYDALEVSAAWFRLREPVPLAASPSDWLQQHDKAKNATIAMLREALENLWEECCSLEPDYNDGMPTCCPSEKTHVAAKAALAQSPADWLAAHDREVAAGELDRIADEECDIVFDGDLPHVTVLWLQIRAAALRGGAK